MSDEEPTKQELLIALMETQADIAYARVCLRENRPLEALRTIEERYSTLDGDYREHYPDP